MAQDLRKVNDIESLMTYFSENLGWAIDPDDYYDIDDITYDFDASDLGLKEEAFAKISSLKQLRPLVDEQRWGIFFVNFESNRFEVSALRKILSGLIPARRNANHAVWDKKDLLFLCTWGDRNKVTIGAAHFEDAEKGLPQIKMISCEPAAEDFTQINIFEQRLAKLAWPSNPSDTAAWHEAWASAFTTRYRQTIQDSHTLTIRLAEEAQNIRDRILSTMEIETSNGYVHLLFEKFRATLVHDMTEQQFADMYAQTVVYGLFSARCMDESQEDFNASEAVECIPNTNPFLKGLLQECLGSNSAKSKLSFDELEVGNIIDLLLHTKTDSIITDFNRQTGGGREDPVIHFYEEFLSEYDKTQRVQRGVYYTPQPVVNFIVRAVDDILKHEFDVQDGLASTEIKKIKYKRESKKRRDGYFKTMVEDEMEVPAIQILDPATGTGTFLRQTILQIYSNFCASRKGMPRERIQAEWNQYVPEYLLPRLNGFELMMAPYAVAHMKLAMVLKDTGYNFERNERLQVYLTNSLEEPGNSDNQINLFEDPLAFESVSANAVKKNTGINVVIGNPPYSTESSNKGEWITDLMDTYKYEADGRTRLQEKNSKPLNDDYIKFIRFGQSVIDAGANGVVGFINPHGFLDGPIFRGMRSSLLGAFDCIYVLDLHGNANRQEIAPDGGKDENVFDIKQGVCIIFLIKNKPGKKHNAKLYRADIWGLRDEKYSYLNKATISTIQWKEIFPQPPLNMFFAEDHAKKADYQSGFSIRDLFNVNGTGVLTKRDELCIHFTPETAFAAAKAMACESEALVKARYNIPKDVRDWKYAWAKKDIEMTGLDEQKVKAITYRPFDQRYVYYTGHSRGFLGWPVHAVMQHMINTDNIALVTARSNKSGNSTHFFVSTNIVEYKCGERTTNSSVFPLYVCEDGAFSRTPNFNAAALKKIEQSLGLRASETQIDKSRYFTARNLFNYIYACLHSPSYRERYGEFLNRDFPVIPYPQSTELFWKLEEMGSKLISLHLLSDYKAGSPAFVGTDTTIDKITFKDNRVYINKNCYFSDVTEDVYNFIVGGYQPCNRWLRERKGRTLTAEGLITYRGIVLSITETIRIMESLEAIISF